ncbi:DEAD/DEAH box helicase [Halofilum ochraceum]|uniref:DEAD/DEAH box helicase n=1 Tax=Halofilum ochraceum TaxID=1611323 RepID=UPI0008D93917|nr:DEAD/DEAH box helicase [Halofilum ochraceum]
MVDTIHKTIDELHSALTDYIEATYHISAPSLIQQRKKLLDTPGVVHQVPYVESTRRYQLGHSFDAIKGLPQAALDIYSRLSGPEDELPRILYDPPYKHQSEAIRYSLVENKNLLVMTGTGSGKTESFLLPVLGRLANEAKESPTTFNSRPAMRALVLYPMNALVNDQLGRLRALFGDRRLVDQFMEWAGRPVRFARYTSRTPYAGVRTAKKDGVKLKPFESFYVDVLVRRGSDDQKEREEAERFFKALQAKGKWPAKDDLLKWMGNKGTEWQNRSTGKFQRAVTQPLDAELLTRHEVQETPPDLLVTNYSMLEYMLMRPIERSIFDSTRMWLEENPSEKFVVVLDEAHLYRGAAGAEVGLLIRRLRDRLHIPPERLQVICSTASFEQESYAPEFGEQLSGIPADTFRAIKGDLSLKDNGDGGTRADAEMLAGIDIDRFYDAKTDNEKSDIIKPLLDHRGSSATGLPEMDLFDALIEYPPMSRLINETMVDAKKIEELGPLLFPEASPETADAAVTTLMGLGSSARREEGEAGLLPCRIHNFFRGLPGLWVCMNPECTNLDGKEKDDICGAMYSQPVERCECGSRVLELFTCRNCGTAYARAYTDDVDAPSALWSHPGHRIRIGEERTEALKPLDLLLERPSNEEVVEPAEYDVETGRLNPEMLGPRMRQVYIRNERIADSVSETGEGSRLESRGQFIPCAVCGKGASFGRSSVQDHQTKGDQPFQALVARQIQIQPPTSTEESSFAPLRGRKVLTFSDSRQVAARLAPNLQMYSVRDSLRPMIAWGFKRLQAFKSLSTQLSLEDLYFAVLLASKELKVRLRPELKTGESFAAEDRVQEAVDNASIQTEDGVRELWMEMRNERPPLALLEDIIKTVQDRYIGFESLAIASIRERGKHTEEIKKLPDLPGVATSDETKVELARAWLRCWQNWGFWLNSMPGDWQNRSKTEGVSVKTRDGGAQFEAIKKLLREKANRESFRDSWTPKLNEIFTENVAGGYRRLRGSELSLCFDGAWVQCRSCRSIHRPLTEVKRCVDCAGTDLREIDPESDQVFLARKGFYRKPVMEALGDKQRRPMALIAAEHTAQLNSPQNEDVFSKAEENELLFQDIALPSDGSRSRATAIDLLSSTTTMEVGIDLGALSGVALRNMPPSRANYQQRSGRAGRRGKAVATVVAFGSSDTHDEHYFAEPDEMIRGAVVDPQLTLDNREIVRRHVRASVLQAYHQDRIRVVDPQQPHDLFSVLGTVSEFLKEDAVLNRWDFENWLNEHRRELSENILTWIPRQLPKSEQREIVDNLVSDCLRAVDHATGQSPDAVRGESESTTVETDIVESVPEEGDDLKRELTDQDKLLDRLLYCGQLPRYAFPTDVATFHVFDTERSTRFRPVMRFAPSQGLPVALSQYAPGKQVWISGKCYTSGAIYSVMKEDRYAAWNDKRLYMECSDCGFARTLSPDEAERNEVRDCTACGGEETFGPARYWMCPPGFAHPIDAEEVTSPDDMPETSYATRAKLTMGTPDADAGWTAATERVRSIPIRQHLLVSNTGPNDEGYTYCVKCGRIEASDTPNPSVSGAHKKPYPDTDRQQTCEGGGATKHLVLGTDFITDILLLSMKVAAPIKLKPGEYTTDVALRTVSEALAQAACQILEIEPGELMAEYRPALTAGGSSGLESEIFLYDTLPGGAGFASQLSECTLDLYRRALRLLQSCPSNCDASCYRCLRSFKNRFEHELLDRHVGAELLEYLIDGRQPEFDEARIRASTDLLCSDLERQSDGSRIISKDARVPGPDGVTREVPILVQDETGEQHIIALSGALTAGHPADPKIRDMLDGTIPVYVENELLVRRNLPTATRNVQRQLKEANLSFR